MRALAAVFIMLILSFRLSLANSHAQPAGQRFVAIAFHDVVEAPQDLRTDSVTASDLVRLFDWLKGNGWSAISLDDIAAAQRGRPLPDKAVLLTFDDGFRSLYSHVFPLLTVYRYPAVAALVGRWMEAPEGATVQYEGGNVARARFISWSEAREMQASGLVEFASHSYDLHHGIRANPQGNEIPAAIARRYDPARGYEDERQYAARIGDDLATAKRQFLTQLGRAPRALAWPFGRYHGTALAQAKGLGFAFALTLEQEPAFTSDPFAIARYFPTRAPNLGVMVADLRFEPPRPATRRIACVSLEAMAGTPGSAAQDALLGSTIDQLAALGANTVVVNAGSGEEVFFSTPLRRLRSDVLSHAVWQLRSRLGADVFVALPGAMAEPRLAAEMIRHVAADGLVLESPVQSASPLAEARHAIRARRAALDETSLDPATRRAVEVYRAGAAVDPRLRLMLALPQPGGPPEWADLALLPPPADARTFVQTAHELQRQDWFRPDVAGRVALSLPVASTQQVAALQSAQRLGATAFAACPAALLPPPPGLSAAFSAATFPYRP